MTVPLCGSSDLTYCRTAANAGNNWCNCIMYLVHVLSCARSGFARFTNTRFSMKKEDISNTYIHLTNVAIQKHALILISRRA